MILISNRFRNLFRVSTLTILLTSHFLLANMANSYASEPDLPDHHSGLSIDSSYLTRYIWHGLDYSNQKPVLQPEMTFSLDNFSAVVWLNYDIETFRAINEYDLTVQYDHKEGSADILFGYTYFTYPHRNAADSEEVWIQGSYQGPFHPTISLHDDFRSENGWYSTLGISQNFNLPLGKVTPSALLYYHAHCYGGTGFPSAEFDLADTADLGKVMSTVKVSYFRALQDGDFKGLDDQTVYSVNFAWSLP
jgi:hypothetical protein